MTKHVKMRLIVLTMLVVASASLTIFARCLHFYGVVYFFKPLTMIFIILIARQKKFETSAFYQRNIIIGLLCSLVGDMFLMFAPEYFIQGLLSFLVAHFFYINAFAFDGRRCFSPQCGVPLIIYGALMILFLFPTLGDLKIPVVIYLLAILLMAWQATSRWRQTKRKGSAFAAFGALLFVASDSMLAIDKFNGDFRGATFLVLGTYFAAQLLVALSI